MKKAKLGLRVGDRLRIKEYMHSDGRPGDIIHVFGINEEGGRFDFKNERSGEISSYYYNPDQFTRLTPDPIPDHGSELDRLIRITNKGARARAKLLKHFHSEVECDKTLYKGPDHNDPGAYIAIVSTLRVKQKPTPVFEPFSISGDSFVAQEGGEADRVFMDGPVLHVGSLKLNAQSAVCSLAGLCRGSCSHDTCSDHDMNCIRSGISIDGGKYHLTWEDAETILAALEKAGV